MSDVTQLVPDADLTIETSHPSHQPGLGHRDFRSPHLGHTMMLALLGLTCAGCFSAPAITGTTQEVVATFTVFDGSPDDGESPRYEVGDKLPAYSLRTGISASGLSGTLTVTCTLTVELQPDALTLEDTGSDGEVGEGDTVTRTFALTDKSGVWDCGGNQTDTITGEAMDSALSSIAGESGVVPVTVWFGDSLAGEGSLTYVGL